MTKKLKVTKIRRKNMKIDFIQKEFHENAPFPEKSLLFYQVIPLPACLPN